MLPNATSGDPSDERRAIKSAVFKTDGDDGVRAAVRRLIITEVNGPPSTDGRVKFSLGSNTNYTYSTDCKNGNCNLSGK